MLGSALTRKGVITAGKGKITAGEGTIRVGENLERHPTL